MKEGSVVSVNFHGSQFTLCETAEVLYVPCSTGDSWKFLDLNTKIVHYVSEGCTVTLVAEPNR